MNAIDIRRLASEAADRAFSMTNAPVDVSIRRSVAGVYDPATGKTGAATVSEFTGKAIFASYNQREIDGSKILATDQKCILRQSEFEAAGKIITTDKLVRDGKALTIVNVQQDAVSVMWVLQVR